MSEKVKTDQGASYEKTKIVYKVEAHRRDDKRQCTGNGEVGQHVDATWERLSRRGKEVEV